ncbi:DUF305 domain-containing protein [Saccharopolyspora sp. NFXS83]|uniref:DUF305 domain-containing protein n=1 Tax=Saccharopolyspora sp. NFXS83 TaxID=2993560 RepID=UPI00224B73A7|nr:DUF305 domain-containing protein [Saccharopolyspora sp. NFXS83]MCX2731720.1 DUF305 domain-containing protein [Saccharopolyspora sp. NFXS83]
MKIIRVAGVSITAAVAAVLLAGCTGSDQAMPGMDHGTPPSASQPPAEAGQHNDADMAFAQGMIPHHTQAIKMSQLAPERAQSEQVKNLARQIEAAQGPEIDTLTGWLKGWGAPAPQSGMSGMDHGDMPGMEHGGMQGMMAPEDMQTLQEAKGAEFDRMFLEMMIKHHEGAVGMARTELAQGQFSEAKQMAEQIISSQQAEIKTMQDLLKQG